MRKNLLNNKKGFLEDWLNTPIIIAKIFIVIFIFAIFFYYFNNTLQNVGIIGDTEKSMIDDITTRHISATDNFVIYVYIGIMIFVLVSAYLVQSNIKFAIIGIIYFLLSVWIIPLFTEFILSIMTANQVTSIVADMMPKTHFIISNMLIIQLLFFVLAAIAFYSKSNVGASDEAI